MSKKDSIEKRRKKAQKEYLKISNKIPKISYINSDQQVIWNAIPLGETYDPARKKVVPVCWYLNDLEKDEVAYSTIPSTSLLLSGSTGSGKTVLECGIVSHVNKFPEHFQIVGIDCKRVEFTGMKSKFNAVLTDVRSAASAAASFRDIMMDRFRFMEANQVNNIYKVGRKQITVDYYTLDGVTYQFDEIMNIFIDLDPKDRNYESLKIAYPSGKQPFIETIDNIYKRLEDGTYKEIDIKGKVYKFKDFKKTSGIYNPKAAILLIDELNEVMCSDDYKSVDTIKSSLGSIARLGRAAGIHLVLGCCRASGSTISTDLKNNIHMCCLLGNFDDGASQLMFDRDISDLCRPEIKGRGFIQSGKEIIETQIYLGEATVKNFSSDLFDK